MMLGTEGFRSVASAVKSERPDVALWVLGPLDSLPGYAMAQALEFPTPDGNVQ